MKIFNEEFKDIRITVTQNSITENLFIVIESLDNTKFVLHFTQSEFASFAEKIKELSEKIILGNEIIRH